MDVKQRRVGLSLGELTRGAGKEWLEIFDSSHEIPFLDGHREIDRVEVGFAGEAAAEIGAGVDRRVILVTARAQESQLSLS